MPPPQNFFFDSESQIGEFRCIFTVQLSNLNAKNAAFRPEKLAITNYKIN